MQAIRDFCYNNCTPVFGTTIETTYDAFINEFENIENLKNIEFVDVTDEIVDIIITRGNLPQYYRIMLNSDSNGRIYNIDGDEKSLQYLIEQVIPHLYDMTKSANKF